MHSRLGNAGKQLKVPTDYYGEDIFQVINTSTIPSLAVQLWNHGKYSRIRLHTAVSFFEIASCMISRENWKCCVALYLLRTTNWHAFGFRLTVVINQMYDPRRVVSRFSQRWKPLCAPTLIAQLTIHIHRECKSLRYLSNTRQSHIVFYINQTQ